MPLSKHIDFFLRCYVRSFTQFSLLTKERSLIRGSALLNELLFDNSEGLMEIYEEIKKSKGGKMSKKLTLERAV